MLLRKRVPGFSPFTQFFWVFERPQDDAEFFFLAPANVIDRPLLGTIVIVPFRSEVEEMVRVNDSDVFGVSNGVPMVASRNRDVHPIPLTGTIQNPPAFIHEEKPVLIMQVLQNVTALDVADRIILERQGLGEVTPHMRLGGANVNSKAVRLDALPASHIKMHSVLRDAEAIEWRPTANREFPH